MFTARYPTSLPSFAILALAAVASSAATPDAASGQRPKARLVESPAPTGIVVTGSPASATVTWNPVPGAVRYSVKRWKQDDLACCNNAVDGLTITTWTDAGSGKAAFAVSGIYVFQVTAVQENGSSGASLVNWAQPVAPSTKVLAQKGSFGPRGQMMSLQAPPPAAAAALGRMLVRAQMAACNPAQPAPGPAPTGFTLVKSWPSGPEFDWPAVPGAVAYVVERAVDDGTYRWTIAGSTCGSPDVIRAVDYNGEARLRFRDILGGVAPGNQYVYKVTALGPAAELGWNSTRWTAPAQTPQMNPPTNAGSTMTLRFGVACGTDLTQLSGVTLVTEILVQSTYGFNQVYPTGGSCGGASNMIKTILGVPLGTHTFTATAQWVQALDPNLPRVIPTAGTSASVTIEIKP